MASVPWPTQVSFSGTSAVHSSRVRLRLLTKLSSTKKTRLCLSVASSATMLSIGRGRNVEAVATAIEQKLQCSGQPRPVSTQLS